MLSKGKNLKFQSGLEKKKKKKKLRVNLMFTLKEFNYSFPLEIHIRTIQTKILVIHVHDNKFFNSRVFNISQ